MATPAVTASIVSGDLGSTFGGGPVPCAAALANLDVIEREGLVENAVRIGRHLVEGARRIGVSRVVGRGLLLGLQLGRPAAPVQRARFTPASRASSRHFHSQSTSAKPMRRSHSSWVSTPIAYTIDAEYSS